jgi:hypothetical protein
MTKNERHWHPLWSDQIVDQEVYIFTQFLILSLAGKRGDERGGVGMGGGSIS